jgi:hypothetical protein
MGSRTPLEVTLTDRRRPGRVDHDDPHLIALLRDQLLIIDPATAMAVAIPEALPGDPGEDPAHGVVIGGTIGAAMWAAVIFAFW